MRLANSRTCAGLIGLAALTLAAGQTQAATINGLFNTGTDATNLALVGGNGVADPHYSIFSSTTPGFAGGQAVTYFNSAYAAEDADSRWISLAANGSSGFNTTVYRTTFDLSGLDPSSAQISGLWAVDNNAEIFLNGSTTGVTLPNGANSFGLLHSFTISSGFVLGLNTLDFRVNDAGPPTALRVDSLAGVAELASPPTGGIPEPSTWTLLILGFGTAGAALRRRRAPLHA
ncbi:MAG: PEPxxWA-CTERM sorting domain-containing protein [Pseudomonadota bacterium]|jgi:hypothetical protein